MLLGAADFYVGDWRDLSAATVAAAAGLGFGTLNLRVQDPTAVTPTDVARTRRVFADQGMVVGQTVGDYGGGLVSPDDAER